MAEWVTEKEAYPALSSNAQGRLVQVGYSEKAPLRLGFFRCALEEEDTWLAKSTCGMIQAKLPNVFSDFRSAVGHMAQRGFTPEHWVLSLELLNELVGLDLSKKEATDLMALQGYVAQVEQVGGLKVLVADLDPGHQILVATPTLSGLMIRSDNYLAVSLWRATSAWAYVHAG